MRRPFLIRGHCFRLKHIMSIITFIIVELCIIMIINTIMTNSYNKKSVELSELHMKYTDIASNLTLGSNILTEQSRLYSETGQTQYLNEYFREANVVKHRDNAISQLKEISPSGEAIDMIETSMKTSMELMEREYYSMRLASIAYGVPEDSLPNEVKSIVLSEDDINLSNNYIGNKARELLFDDTYMKKKEEIISGVDGFLNSMIESSEAEYTELTKKVNKYSNIQTVVIILVFLIVLLMMLFQYCYVVRPLIKASKSIERGHTIDMPDFLAEMNSLGISYNSLLSKNMRLMEEFRLVAETDALTSLGNRSAYNAYSEQLHKGSGEVLMFLFDVNNLRDINNTKGHVAGDELLVKAAKCIFKVFDDKMHNNCFRIGGDEFVAYICGKSRKMACRYIQDFKKEQEKYNITIAVGYSYTHDISTVSAQEMFNEADEMMYQKKRELKKIV